MSAQTYNAATDMVDRNVAEGRGAKLAFSDPARRREYDEAGGLPRPEPGATAGAFEFAGFDFSFAARGTEAATFSELFAEVLHPPAQPEGKAEPGADLHAALTVTFEESLRGADRQVIVTRQVPCGA